MEELDFQQVLHVLVHALVGIAVHREELVHFFLWQNAQRYMMVVQAVYFPQIVNGLMFQYQLAIAVKLARSAKAGDSSHLLTPFRRGMAMVLSLSANRMKWLGQTAR